MNIQEAFDTALNHIREQGAPSIDRSDENHRFKCVYRNPEGFGCAAAPFIKEYSKELDDWDQSGGVSFQEICVDYPDQIVDGIVDNPELVKFIGYLQDIHDEAALQDNFLETYEEMMADLAENTGLDY